MSSTPFANYQPAETDYGVFMVEEECLSGDVQGERVQGFSLPYSPSTELPPDISPSNANGSKGPLQIFTALSSNDWNQSQPDSCDQQPHIFMIETQLDLKTGKNVVYWSDLLDVFKATLFIQKKDGERVAFMKDHDGNVLMPLRIGYSADPIWIVSHTLDIDIDIDPNFNSLSQGPRIEPGRKLSTSALFRIRLSRAIFRKKHSLSSLGSDSIVKPKEDKKSSALSIKPKVCLPKEADHGGSSNSASGDTKEKVPSKALAQEVSSSSNSDMEGPLPSSLVIRQKDNIPQPLNSGYKALRDDGTPRCQGFAKTQGRQCLNRTDCPWHLAANRGTVTVSSPRLTVSDGNQEKQSIPPPHYVLPTLPFSPLQHPDRSQQISIMTRTTTSKSLLPVGLPVACNVLLIGETLTGKSTFVEAVRHYANQTYVVVKTKLSRQALPVTKEVDCTRVETDLPSYKVMEDSEDDLQPNAISPDIYLDEENDWEDYEENVNRCKGLKLNQVAHSGAMYQFDLYDTPGLNNTSGVDECCVNAVIQALRTVDKIHLVLVMVGPDPFTKGFLEALQYYMAVFPEFQGVVAFVHTKVDYVNLHPRRKDFHNMFMEKKDLLHKVMGRTNCQHFVIDCDFSSKPIRASITLNTIRKILYLAPYNEPVTINKLSLPKTVKMRAMDWMIIIKYSAMIDAIIETIGTKNVSQASILQQFYELGTKLNALQTEMTDGEEFIAKNNTGELVMIHEDRFEETSRLVHVCRPHYMTLPKQRFTIRKVMLLQDGTDIITQKGGMNSKAWEIEFQRKPFEDGVLHVKLYATSAEKHLLAISERRVRAVRLKSEIQEAEGLLREHKKMHEGQQQEIDQLVEQNRRYSELISLAKKDKLHIGVFNYLVEQKVYTGEADENALRVEEIYLQLVQ